MMQSYLNEENLQKSAQGDVEWHPLRPFLPPNARVLFLGSFPPPRQRWCIDFFYPNYINDHWRIEGLVWYGNKNHFVDEANKTFRLPEIIEFCEQKGLAFFDTATCVRRLAGNASDKFLEVVQPTDINALTAHLPHLKAIAVTGEKARQTLAVQTSVQVVRLPSSSRAYPLAIEKKAAAYADFFRSVDML